MAERPMDRYTRERLAQIKKMRRALKGIGEEPLPYSGWTKNVGFSTPWEAADWEDATADTPPVVADYEEIGNEEAQEKEQLDKLCSDKAAECTNLLNYSANIGKAEVGQMGQAPNASTRVSKIEYECYTKSSISCEDIKRLENYEELLKGEETAQDILLQVAEVITLSGGVTLSFHKYGGVVIYHDIDYQDFYKFVTGFSFGKGVRDLESKCSTYEYLVHNQVPEKSGDKPSKKTK